MLNFGEYNIASKEFIREDAEGNTVKILGYVLKLDRYNGERPDSGLKGTYRNKRLVDINGTGFYGEIAIINLLKKDGWSGVWIDSYHSKSNAIKLWSSMPPNGQATLTGMAKKIFENIFSENTQNLSGFFDVFVWRNTDYAFIEYKGPGDRPNANESRWIKSAFRAGVSPEQLFFVQLK